jgi:hypothetical protein
LHFGLLCSFLINSLAKSVCYLSIISTDKKLVTVQQTAVCDQRTLPAAIEMPQWHWDSNAPTMMASLVHGKPWIAIADFPDPLEQDAKIPKAPSPCLIQDVPIFHPRLFVNMTL